MASTTSSIPSATSSTLSAITLSSPTSSATSPTSSQSFLPTSSSSSSSSSKLPYTAHDMAPGGQNPTSPVSASGTSMAHHHNDSRSDGLLNYYFLFIALLVIFLFLGTYAMVRRKRRLKTLQQSRQQNALARDLEGWRDPRSWRNRRWRTGPGGSWEARREEGLNEAGEAPPPYQPNHESRNSRAELQIPLRTLDRDDVGLKPPDYHEVESSGDGRTTNGSGEGTIQTPESVQTRRET